MSCHREQTQSVGPNWLTVLLYWEWPVCFEKFESVSVNLDNKHDILADVTALFG